MQHELEEAESRADEAETNVARMRSKSRTSMSIGRAGGMSSGISGGISGGIGGGSVSLSLSHQAFTMYEICMLYETSVCQEFSSQSYSSRLGPRGQVCPL